MRSIFVRGGAAALLAVGCVGDGELQQACDDYREATSACFAEVSREEASREGE